MLWRKVAEHPEAQRIIELFPSAQVRIIEHQRATDLPSIQPGKALLIGKRTIMIGQTTSFVKQFDGRLGIGVHCRQYHKLVPISNGCPYNCTYCYLAYVYRAYAPFIKININYDTMFKQIRRALNTTEGKVAFNMGEMLDSLALDHITNLTRILIPFFSGLSRGFLMLLTKSANIDNLLLVEPNPQTVLSWSLNNQQMIDAHEGGTASLNERIEAAKRCQKHGYRIRLRIDPGIVYPGWKAGYGELIQKMLTALDPENVTLGMLRILPGHFHLIQETFGNKTRQLLQHNLVRRASDGKLR